MNTEDHKIKWLNQILKERVGDELSLEIISGLNDVRKYAIKHLDNHLVFDEIDFTQVSDIQVKCLDDVFDLVFFYLSRSEEYSSPHKDIHDRFPALVSAAYKSGILDRPVVDECIEIIRKAISRQWPQFKLTKLYPKTIVTCDVDHPYEFYTSNKIAFIKKLGADLLKRKSLNQFRRNWKNYWCTYQGDYSADPNKHI